MVLGRKKRRIAQGPESVCPLRDYVIPEERWSFFSKLQRKWAKASRECNSGSLSEQKHEAAPQRILSRRHPGIRLRARVLLKKVKETCLKAFSSRLPCTRNDVGGELHSVKRPHHAAMVSTRAANRCRWRRRNAAKLNESYCDDHKHSYAMYPSHVDEDAIADCIEFIKRSSSASSSSASSLTSSTPSSSTWRGGICN